MLSSKVFAAVWVVLLIQMTSTYYIQSKEELEDQTERRILKMIDDMLERRHFNAPEYFKSRTNEIPRKCPDTMPFFNEVTGKCEAGSEKKRLFDKKGVAFIASNCCNGGLPGK